MSSVAIVPVDFAQRPMLVFWETTRACGLACRHCRADAMLDPQPGQLSYDEGVDLLDQVAAFGRPYPVVVFTGGDCLRRYDLFDLLEHAHRRGLPTALSPSVTPLLTPATIRRIARSGVKAVSISLDGALPATHDGVRGIPGHHAQTLDALRAFVETGVTLQVNTTVMRGNVHELPELAGLLADIGVDIWEVFFLVPVGRGGGPQTTVSALDPAQNLAVCHFLVDAAHYGFVVRTVEAPYFRRVTAQRRDGSPPPDDDLYRRLSGELVARLGPPRATSRAHTASTRDGKGIVFVAHDGQVYPAGFLPMPLGSVRDEPLATIYQENEYLVALRYGGFTGRCGRCEVSDLCGGSRSRAWAATGNLLAEDPSCPFPA